MNRNEPKWWHVALFGALSLAGGVGALYSFKQVVRRGELTKQLKDGNVMSLKDVQQLTEKWEEILKKPQGSVKTKGNLEKVVPLKDVAMVGRLYSQFAMVDPKSGCKYLFERREVSRVTISRRVSNFPKSWEERHHNEAVYLVDSETETTDTSVKGARLDIRDTRALLGAASKVFVKQRLGEMTVWRQLTHRLFYVSDAIYGAILDLLGLGFIFEIGTQHSKIQVGLLSSAIVVATVDLDPEANAIVIRDILACAANIEDLHKLLMKQSQSFGFCLQLCSMMCSAFGMAAFLTYQKKLKFSETQQTRAAALDKFLAYPQEAQEKLQCIPCQAAVKQIVCLPCKHAVACEDCWSVTQNKGECMVCKQAITGTARILDS